MTTSYIDGRVTTVSPIRCQLGEGPVWLPATEELLYVDIFQGDVHSYSARTTETVTRHFDGAVGAAIPTIDGSLLIAIDNRLRLLDETGAAVQEWRVEEGLSNNRFNDCGCDPAGRVWAGTMSKTRVPGSAALYRLGVDRRLETALPNTTLSNGMGWSPDNTVMYFVDSVTQRIDAFDFDLTEGTVSNRRTFAAFSPEAGLPDGLTVDVDGGVWVALAGGSAIRRYLPDGQLDSVIALPVSHPTSLTFGGSDLRTIFITTSCFALSPAELAAEPMAGGLLAMESEVAGLPATPYGG